VPARDAAGEARPHRSVPRYQINTRLEAGQASSPVNRVYGAPIDLRAAGPP